MKITRLPCLFLLILLSQSLDAAATLYRWQDEAGQFHFSDKAPEKSSPAIQLVEIKSKPLNSMPAVAPFNPPITPRKIEKRKTSKPTKKPNTKRCQKYQRQLDTLRSRMRLGYSATQAPKLLRRERELNEKIYHQCQKEQ
ncbi:hypothetical protein MNBD_GAMMA18-84 [hydrothermal vent metagenome]|uniref:DUF4124 domain-containing protein n=1 Tax=hydrothermal vent metagenome TaxID=652676 RepID=A0A3B0YS97_9ZZZZ